MSETVSAVGQSVTIKREFAWPPDKLFDAWTRPELLCQWFAPSAAMRSVATNDLKVGGPYRIAFRHEDSTEFVAFGVYRELDPPNKLAFTWSWEGGVHEPAETLVTVSFVQVSGGTELTLTHELLSNEQSAVRHTQGWNGCLDALQRFIDG
jgi:uncharacterized protein YndB with AHSA1/START domain